MAKADRRALNEFTTDQLEEELVRRRRPKLPKPLGGDPRELVEKLAHICNEHMEALERGVLIGPWAFEWRLYSTVIERLYGFSGWEFLRYYQDDTLERFEKHVGVKEREIRRRAAIEEAMELVQGRGR